MRPSSRAATVSAATAALRLLVADAPAPFVLDVDRGSLQRVTGLAAHGTWNVGVLPIGKIGLGGQSRDRITDPSSSTR